MAITKSSSGSKPNLATDFKRDFDEQFDCQTDSEGDDSLTMRSMQWTMKGSTCVCPTL